MSTSGPVLRRSSYDVVEYLCGSGSSGGSSSSGGGGGGGVRGSLNGVIGNGVVRKGSAASFLSKVSRIWTSTPPFCSVSRDEARRRGPDPERRSENLKHLGGSCDPISSDTIRILSGEAGLPAAPRSADRILMGSLLLGSQLLPFCWPFSRRDPSGEDHLAKRCRMEGSMSKSVRLCSENLQRSLCERPHHQ